MQPKQHSTTGSSDLFRAWLEQIINMKHELVQSGARSTGHGSTARLRRSTATMGGRYRDPLRDRALAAQTHLRTSDEGVSECWVHDPYFRVPRTLAGTSAVLC